MWLKIEPRNGPCCQQASIYLIILYSGWWLTYPLKNMSSSVGMMTFQISQYMENKKCSKPPTSYIPPDPKIVQVQNLSTSSMASYKNTMPLAAAVMSSAGLAPVVFGKALSERLS